MVLYPAFPTYNKTAAEEWKDLDKNVENLMIQLGWKYCIVRFSKVVCCRCFKMCLQVGRVVIHIQTGYTSRGRSLTLSLIRQFCSRRLNVFCQNIKNLYNWMDNLWLKVENIVAKGEIARFVQFLLLSLSFQKGVCCRGVRKRLYEEKS